MTYMREWLEQYDTEILLLDGFDDALIGTAQRCGQPILAVYDWQRIVQVLMRDNEIDYEEAVDYVDFNIAGAWVGPQTPIILDRPEWIHINSTAPDESSPSGAPSGELDGQLSVFDADPNWDGVAPI